jgi:hypothetical protein
VGEGAEDQKESQEPLHSSIIRCHMHQYLNCSIK